MNNPPVSLTAATLPYTGRARAPWLPLSGGRLLVRALSLAPLVRGHRSERPHISGKAFGSRTILGSPVQGELSAKPTEGLFIRAAQFIHPQKASRFSACPLIRLRSRCGTFPTSAGRPLVRALSLAPLCKGSCRQSRLRGCSSAQRNSSIRKKASRFSACTPHPPSLTLRHLPHIRGKAFGCACRGFAAFFSKEKAHLSPSERRVRRKLNPPNDCIMAKQRSVISDRCCCFWGCYSLKIHATSVNSQCAAMPAQRPPTVWQRIALPVKRLHFSASIMETCVER